MRRRDHFSKVKSPASQLQIMVSQEWTSVKTYKEKKHIWRLKGDWSLRLTAQLAAVKDGMNWIDSSIELGECYSYQVRLSIAGTEVILKSEIWKRSKNVLNSLVKNCSQRRHTATMRRSRERFEQCSWVRSLKNKCVLYVFYKNDFWWFIDTLSKEV